MCNFLPVLPGSAKTRAKTNRKEMQRGQSHQHRLRAQLCFIYKLCLILQHPGTPESPEFGTESPARGSPVTSASREGGEHVPAGKSSSEMVRMENSSAGQGKMMHLNRGEREGSCQARTPEQQNIFQVKETE